MLFIVNNKKKFRYFLIFSIFKRKEILECKKNIELLEIKRDKIYNSLKNAQTNGDM